MLAIDFYFPLLRKPTEINYRVYYFLAKPFLSCNLGII